MFTPAALKLRLDSQGNVGIGSNAAVHKLHVEGGDVNVDSGSSYRINNVPVLTETALGDTVVSSSLETLGNVSALTVTGNVTVGGGALFVDATQKRVGLGTTSPGYELDVVGDVNVTGSFNLPSALKLQTNGRDMFPENTADTTSISGLGSATDKWWGGVLVPNGRIYGIPWHATSVLIIDPVTNTADTTTITGLSGSEDKWSGGVLAPNGKIYCIPLSATSVLIIDPVTNTVDTTTIAGLSGTTFKWGGGVLAPNGKIYGIPYSATSVLIIDPVTNTANTTAITGLTGSDKWSGGVLAPNGKIYGIPRGSTSVLIIDPVTNTANTTIITGLSGDSKWSGGVQVLWHHAEGVDGADRMSVSRPDVAKGSQELAEVPKDHVIVIVHDHVIVIVHVIVRGRPGLLSRSPHPLVPWHAKKCSTNFMEFFNMKKAKQFFDSTN